MPTLIRYILLQIPGWVLLAGLLMWLVSNDWLGQPVAFLIMALWLAKDALLYPLARSAYQGDSPPVGAEALVGRQARTVTELAPHGVVKVAGELWIAQGPVNQSIAKGHAVRITASKGLILTVEPVQ